ncbi:hypothetical protein MOO46_07755 (plasmid) [Apilactobacillus apisilvae]|uniref:Uncharacterized protein n=1 Tax=Apilactobacillus apisilvae TaxID=2923364 RepID=A0ABY4PKX0_9LACO|nr:hypothetical protein [Apilactobacillus apisilvae]UQS85827.1 hypothetical protein MOO46_07755 [Apilactobacillus apisilvae]
MEIYATVPETIDDTAMCIRLDPIEYGQDIFYGWKIIHYKDVDLTDDDIKNYKSHGITDDRMPKTKSVIDDNKPIKYDNITKQIIDISNMQQSFIKSQLSNNTANMQFSKQDSQLQQALIKSQQELMNAKTEIKNMQQMIIKAQLSNMNNGGKNNEQLSK